MERPEEARSADSTTPSCSSSSSSESEAELAAIENHAPEVLSSRYERRGCWPPEFGISDGGVAAWPRGSRAHRGQSALEDTQEFDEARAVR